MKKELSGLEEVLVNTIEKANKTAGDAIDFASAQMPDLIHQLLVWKMAESILVMLLCLLFVILGYFATKKWFEESDGAILIPVGIVGIFVLIIFPVALFQAIQIYFAPKLFLIEYAANLVK